jgi:prepilin-type processing-associated H-X9-DG protein
VCASNLHQLATAAAAYEIDNGGYFPDVTAWVQSNMGTAHFWATTTDAAQSGILYRYLKSPGVYVCPTFRLVCGSDTAYFSYSMNWILGNPHHAGPPPPYVVNALAGVKNPSGTLLFAEENSWTINDKTSFELNDGLFCVPSVPCDGLATFHLTPWSRLDYGYSQVAFVDGHVGIHELYEGYNLVRGQ